LEAAYTEIRYDDERIQDNTTKRGKFSLDNIERQQGFAWGLNYDYIRTEYETSLPWEYQRAALNIGYWVSSSVRIFAVGGVETNPENLLEPNLDASFWEAGFQFSPNQRTNLEAAWGERYYGPSFRLRAEYMLKRGSTSLSYNEGPTTRAQLPTGRRPITDTDSLDGILDQPGRSDQFLRRRLEWSTNIELAKSNLTLRVFGERREQRTTDDGVPLDDQELAGVAMRWSWRMGAKTTFGIAGDFSRRRNTQREDDLRRLQAYLDYRLSQRFSLRGVIMNSRQKALGSSEFDYVENQYQLLLSTAF